MHLGLRHVVYDEPVNHLDVTEGIRSSPEVLIGCQPRSRRWNLHAHMPMLPYLSAWIEKAFCTGCLTELAGRFHAPLSTVHGEVQRLTDAALLRRRDAGRSAMVRANPDNRLVKPLTESDSCRPMPTTLSAGNFGPGAVKYGFLRGGRREAWIRRLSSLRMRPPPRSQIACGGENLSGWLRLSNRSSRWQRVLAIPVHMV